MLVAPFRYANISRYISFRMSLYQIMFIKLKNTQ